MYPPDEDRKPPRPWAVVSVVTGGLLKMSSRPAAFRYATNYGGKVVHWFDSAWVVWHDG